MAKLFGIPLYYKNKLELARRFLDIYFIVKPPKEDGWVEKATEALAFFLVYGFSKEGEDKLQYCLTKKITKNYVRVLKNKLKQNGYIVTDQTNHQERLSDEMENCRKQLFENNVRTFTIGFIKND